MTIELNETHKNMRIHSVGVLKCIDSIVKFIYIFPNRVHIYKLTDQLRRVFMKGSEFNLEVDERTLAARKVTQFLKIKKLQSKKVKAFILESYLKKFLSESQ